MTPRFVRVSPDFSAYVVWAGALPIGTVWKVGRRPGWHAKTIDGTVTTETARCRDDAAATL